MLRSVATASPFTPAGRPHGVGIAEMAAHAQSRFAYVLAVMTFRLPRRITRLRPTDRIVTGAAGWRGAEASSADGHMGGRRRRRPVPARAPGARRGAGPARTYSGMGRRAGHRSRRSARAARAHRCRRRRRRCLRGGSRPLRGEQSPRAAGFRHSRALRTIVETRGRLGRAATHWGAPPLAWSLQSFTSLCGSMLVSAATRRSRGCGLAGVRVGVHVCVAAVPCLSSRPFTPPVAGPERLDPVVVEPRPGQLAARAADLLRCRDEADSLGRSAAGPSWPRRGRRLAGLALRASSWSRRLRR
jgi:hypothetical protein